MADEEDSKSFRLKMTILVLSIVALCFILYPIVLGAKVIDKSMSSSKDAAPVKSTSFIERCQEAFDQSPFAVASVFIMMTAMVVLSTGIVVYSSYLNKED